MFEGAFSLWHILIVLAVFFVVVGPRRVQRMMGNATDALSRFADGEGDGEGREGAAPAGPPPKKTLAYRYVRWRARRKGRKAGTAGTSRR
jgi:hypothetical protein